jgi:hypothetical protein
VFPNPDELVLRHYGIIVQRAVRWYWRLPINVRAVYDLDDMVADAVLHVREKQALYLPEKSMESTWVYHVANRWCQDKVTYCLRSFRNVETVPLDDKETAKLSQDSLIRQRVSLDAVERVIEFASDGCRDLIAILLSGGARRASELPEPAREAIPELLKRSRDQHANLDDFLLAHRLYAQ